MAIRHQAVVLTILRATTALAAVSLAAPHALAQEVTGTIRGDVTDDAGEPISGAIVTITHVPSGTRSVQTTGADGNFSAPNLRIGGPFDIKVVAPGFEDASATITSIQAGQPQRISVFLVPEGQTIEVTAARTQRSSIAIATGPATSLTAREITAVSNVNRDIRNLAARDPLVTLDPTNGSISIAGQNNRFNRISVDGLAFGDPFGLEAGGLASARGSVPLDAIAEFTVESAPVDIQQGGFQGGAINTVLKSGGNAFDISGFYTYADDTLGGSRTRDRRVTRDFESRIFGVQVTGPLIKDKLFFAVTYEGLRAKTPADIGIAGEGFANSVPNLTRAQVNEVKRIAQARYSFDTLDVPTSAEERDDKLVVKLDWNIADGHRAAFTYIYNKGNILAGLDSSTSVTSPLLTLQSNNYDQGAINHYGVFQLNSEWSESFSTQARVSYHDYERLQVPFGPREFGQFVVCQDTAPGQSGSALITCPSGIARVRFGPDISRQANELFVKTLGVELQARIQGGGHDVKIIAERRGQDISNLFAQRVSGDWYFDTVADFDARRANQLDYALPLRGDIDTVRALFDSNVYTFGVQDTWEINNRLTFIFGFRYDLYESPDQPFFNQAFLNRHGFPNNGTLNGRDVLQPRFGLNWRAADRLRVRATAGLFAGGSPNVWISNSYSNPGPTLGRVQVERLTDGTTFRIVQGLGLTPAEQNVIGAATLNNVSGGTGVPDILKQAILRTGTAASPTNAISPDFEIPSQWRLSGTLDYIANLGPLGDDWNVYTSVIWSRVKDALTWTDLRSVRNTVQGTLPDGRPRYQAFDAISGTNTDIVLTNTSRGYSWNVVFGLNKRWTNGLAIGGSYTLQRVKDVNPGLSSVAFSNYDGTASDDPNGSAYGTSRFQVDNSYRLRLGYDFNLWNDNATRFEMFFNSRAGQRFSHTFFETGSGRSPIFGVTGNRGRMLMYVPNVSSPTADPIVTYATGFDFSAFQAFINDSGLDRFQGQIAPKNFGRAPRFEKLDLSLRQEIPFFLGGKIEVFGDIENVLNLINSDWGSLRQVAFPGRANIVNVACQTVSGSVVTPVTSLSQRCDRYVYSNFNRPNEILQTGPSLWQIRVGVRLGFRGFNFRD